MSVVSSSCARATHSLTHARKVRHSRTREPPARHRDTDGSFTFIQYCVRTDCCDGGVDRRRDVRQVSDVRLQFYILGE